MRLWIEGKRHGEGQRFHYFFAGFAVHVARRGLALVDHFAHLAVEAAIAVGHSHVHVDPGLIALCLAHAIGTRPDCIVERLLIWAACRRIVIDANGDGIGSKRGERMENRWQREEHALRLTDAAWWLKPDDAQLPRAAVEWEEQPMRLLFDHGTLVLAEAPELKPGRVPGLVWDPRVALFRAPAWRYSEVSAALRHSQPPVRDEVSACTLPRPASWSELPLRPYQRAALLSWELSGRRGTVVLPTGSGKTQVALAALRETAARGLCLVPTRALLQQWTSALNAAYRGKVGCLGDGRRDLQAITVATFESAYRLMPRIGSQFELLVVDEAHHFGSGVRDEALKMSTAPQRLGLTATLPSEPASSQLADLIGPTVYQLSISDLAGKWLADFDLVTVQLGLNPAERAAYAADRRIFSAYQRRVRSSDPDASWQDFASLAAQSPEGRAALRAWQRNRLLLHFTQAKAEAVAVLLARHRDSRVIIFTADNAAAYRIAREHLVMPITCEISRAEREAALSAFRAGTLRCLVSARVLNEGIDLPQADVAVIVSGTQGAREHVQRVGRLLRPAPGKRALIYQLATRATPEIWRAIERRQALAPATAAAR